MSYLFFLTYKVPSGSESGNSVSSLLQLRIRFLLQTLVYRRDLHGAALPALSVISQALILSIQKCSGTLLCILLLCDLK